MMSSSEVKNVFNRVDSTHTEVKQNVQVDYNVGDILDVVGGAFVGQKVTVSSVQGNKIIGQVDLFGRTISAELSIDQVYKPES